MKRRSLLTSLLAAPFARPALAEGDDWPVRPVRIVCPFTAGGSQDNVARRLSVKLTEQFGQSFVIDNRTGASGSIAADNVAKSAPDGYSVLLGNIGSHALVPHLYAHPPYNPLTDLETAAWIGTQPNILVCHPSFPHNTVPKLIAAAKKEPGRINFGSAGNGTPGHLTGEMFAKAAGVELKHVPYKGSAPAVTDLLGGTIPLMFDPVQSVLQHVKGGKLRALAVSSSARAAVLPQVPTLNEAGLKGFEATAWWALFAPANLPAPIASRLASEAARIVQAEAFREKLLEIGVQPGGASQPFAEFQRSEMAKWGAAVRDSGVTLE